MRTHALLTAAVLTMLLSAIAVSAGVAPPSSPLPGPEAAPPARNWLVAGIQAFDVRDFENAEILLSQALEARGLEEADKVSALMYRAATRNMLGDFDLMLLDSQSLVELRPDDPAPHLFKGQALFGLSMWDQAIVSFTRAITLAPDNPSTYHYRGDAWVEVGDTHKAMADYELALNADPGYFPAALQRGRLWRRMGRPDMAVQDFTLVLDIVPDHPQVLFLRGQTYLEMGDTEKAAQDMERARKLDPDVEKGLDLTR